MQDQKNFLFSVIIPVYNVEKYLEETIESVINQTIGFENNVQLILINDGSPDDSESICLKYKELYPENVVYYKQENAGVSAARNKGIELATGELTTFLDSDDLWSEDAFKETYYHYKKHPEISLFSCRMNFFDAKKGGHPLNYKYREDKIVDILEEYKYPQLSSSSIFIKTSVLKNYRYDKNIKYSEDNKLINEIIFDEQKIMMLKKPIYYYRKREEGTSAIQGQTMNISWYLITPKEVYKYLFDLSIKKFGRVIEYIQYLVIYELSWRIAINTNFEISDKDRKEYTNLLSYLINNLDDEIIIDNRHLDLSRKLFLLKEKKAKETLDNIKFNEDYLEMGEKLISKKRLGILLIDQMYIINNELRVYGKLDTLLASKKEFGIYNCGKQIPINYYALTNDYDIETYNGKTLHKYLGINFTLNINENWELIFKVNDDYIIPRFKRASFLTEYLKRSYHHEGQRTIVFKKYKIVNQKRNIFKSAYYELRNELNLFKRKNYKLMYARLNTKFMSLFKKKKIWLISDRVNKADDNGEHFFKYMVENHPEIDSYYILTKNSPDYERLKKIGKVLDPNSNKYKLLFHRSDYVVSSHAENYIFNPLGNNGKYICDQQHFKYIFLQHGIIKDDLSPWLNVNTKKMDMFVTSSTPEYDSLLKEKYYFGPDVVKLTGLPRYDTLLDKQEKYKVKKQILISFTWRNALASKIDKKTGERIYNEEFKNTDYFKNINNFINDKELLKVLKDNDYIIRFCPHPNVLIQLDDFQDNEFVQIEKGNINYQKEFCENALLITDYSSVFFDFAYLKKPIIYFQPDREEFFSGQLYEKGYFDYEKTGFGPVCYNYKDLVSKTIEYIKEDCQLNKKYQNRIESFFKFKDKKNCERVYNEIIALNSPDERKNK